MMILNLSIVKPLDMAKRNMAYFVKFKTPSKTAVVLIAGVTIAGTPCPRHIIIIIGISPASYMKDYGFLQKLQNKLELYGLICFEFGLWLARI